MFICPHWLLLKKCRYFDEGFAQVSWHLIGSFTFMMTEIHVAPPLFAVWLCVAGTHVQTLALYLGTQNKLKPDVCKNVLQRRRLLYVFYRSLMLVVSTKCASKGRFTHNMPRPCRAAKGLEYVFPTWFTQFGRVWFTLAMPCPCYAPTIPFFSRPRYCTSFERRPVGYLLAFGFFRLPSGIPRRLLSDANQSHMQVASVKPNTVCHGRGKDWEQHTTKKTICYTVGLAVGIFPATMRTFRKSYSVLQC